MTPKVTRNLARLARSALSAVLSLAITCNVATSTSAFAQEAANDLEQPDVERAESHAERAYQAYVRKDYATAVRLYLEAYRAAPAPDILYNIAGIYEIGLHDHMAAIKFYRDFIVDPDADPRRVEVASARLKRLEEPARAAPEIAAPPEAAIAAPSEAAIAAPSEAAADPSSDVRPRSSSTRADRVTVSAPWSAWRIGAVVAASAGLAAIGVGAIFGVEAMSQAKVVHDDCEGGVCASERGVSAVHDATKSADIATLSFALGGLLIASGAALLWVDPDAPQHPLPPGQLSWSPLATDSKLGLTLAGAW
jgi:hypothetical protein